MIHGELLLQTTTTTTTLPSEEAVRQWREKNEPCRHKKEGITDGARKGKGKKSVMSSTFRGKKGGILESQGTVEYEGLLLLLLPLGSGRNL